MADLQTQSTEKPKNKEGAPSSLDTRGGLDSLGQNVGDKQHLMSQVQDILNNYSTDSPAERKAKLLGVATAAALGYIFSEDEEKAAPQPERKRKVRRKREGSASFQVASAKPDTEEQASEETDKESPAREKYRKVVCDDMRLICINTDPAKNMVPKECNGNSNYLLEYGLPEFDTFTEEMIDILAPDTENKEEGMNKVADILKRCPMGKYQCMPQYLFGNVKKFKELNLDWKSKGQGKEKLHAMWEFLQNEEMQKEATRVYLSQSASRYGGDAELVAASFYGGGRAADALKAYKDGTATPEQKEYVEKRQGAYQSILNYSGTSKSSGPFNIEAELSRTASRESGNLEGKKSKPRDGSGWENDPRFAYNRNEQVEQNNQIA